MKGTKIKGNYQRSLPLWSPYKSRPGVNVFSMLTTSMYPSMLNIQCTLLCVDFCLSHPAPGKQMFFLMQMVHTKSRYLFIYHRGHHACKVVVQTCSARPVSAKKLATTVTMATQPPSYARHARRSVLPVSSTRSTASYARRVSPQRYGKTTPLWVHVARTFHGKTATLTFC